VSGRPCRRRPWHASGGQQAHREGEAFTILEALIGVVILTASIGALAVVTAQQFGRSSDVDVLDRVENAVARDLGWLKTYAKYWRLASGPYDLSCVPAGFPAGCTVRNFSSGTTDYQPDEALCATATGLADAFVTAAGSANSETIIPARPFSPVTSGATALSVAGLPAGMTLQRTITTTRPQNTSPNNLVYVSYALLQNGQPSSYNFVREVALRPEAAAWCP
jgi:hypothetical protein